jgi:hypothetical protein
VAAPLNAKHKRELLEIMPNKKKQRETNQHNFPVIHPLPAGLPSF